MKVVKKEILLVDDEDWYVEPIIFRLKHYGYNISYSQTIKGALSKIENNSFNLIITDLKLPSGAIKIDYEKYLESGLFLIHKIREKDSSIPVIAFTANGDEKLHDLPLFDFDWYAVPQTIQIFLPDGSPRSIKIAEITNRVVKAILLVIMDKH